MLKAPGFIIMVLMVVFPPSLNRWPLYVSVYQSLAAERNISHGVLGGLIGICD